MSKTTSPPPPFVKAVTENWGSVKFHVKRAQETRIQFSEMESSRTRCFSPGLAHEDRLK